MAKATVKKIGVRSSSRRTLQFGMVNVGIASMPATDVTARIKGRYADPDTLGKVAQQYVNEAGVAVKPVKVYEIGDKVVQLAEDEVPKLDSEDTIKLVANVTDVPSEWILSTALAWPADATHDGAYALVSHYLRHNGRVFVGTTVANGTTKVLAIRWSEVYGCLVMQTLAYHAQVRWDKADLIREGVAEIPAPDDQMVVMAGTIFDSIPDGFKYEDVTDEYGEALFDAVTAKAAGTFAKATTAPDAPAPAADLMAALAASLPKAGKSKSKKEVPA